MAEGGRKGAASERGERGAKFPKRGQIDHLTGNNGYTEPPSERSTIPVKKPRIFDAILIRSGRILFEYAIVRHDCDYDNWRDKLIGKRIPIDGIVIVDVRFECVKS
jgi:hypothetical protein